MNEEELFHQVLDQPPGARDVFLDAACGEDVGLRQRMDVLLGAHFNPQSFLQTPAGAACCLTVNELTVAVPPGTVIGPYKLLEQIGEGGMGVVYMAEQTAPVRRKVALKVIKPGMDSRQVIARFEAERQALAQMDHPNIARVLDAGTTQHGLPYFVMELVRGIPMTEFCDQNQLTPRQRLELFVTVCQAVQHAHQKGIIHRDIKPSNVMITLHDDKPIAKVIDFGVAKATSGQLTDKTLFTGFTQMVGTPLYMSPEQAGLSDIDVDTRSDIYSLGVLLYELLTGTTPFDRLRLKEATYDEIRRIIRDEEPQRPSTRLSSLGATLPRNSFVRRTEVQKLGQLLRGELDWIVMKALEKDRTRRYETASGLAADVQRYLSDEPVLACPPSTLYRLRKLARRNQGAFLATAAAVVALSLGMTTLAASTLLIRQEQARTREEKDRAETAQKLAYNRAKEIQEGLENLKAANALLDRGRWYASVREWDAAQDALSEAARLRPDHASVWVERGELYANLGLWDLAAADFAREYALREPDATARLYRLALLRQYIGDAEGYRKVCRRMRERFDGTLKGQFAAEVIRASVLATDPEANLAPLLELAQNLLAPDPDSWYIHYLLGVAHYRACQFESAVQQLRESLRGHPDLAVAAISYPVLAMAHHRLGETAQARQALDAAAGAIDRWTQDRYQIRGNYWLDHGVSTYWPIAWWDWLECRLYYGEATMLIDGTSPPDDSRLHVLRARAFAGMHWWREAIPEYEAALTLRPQDDLIRAEAHHNRGYHFTSLGEWDEAAAQFANGCTLMPEHSQLWRYLAVAEIAAGDVNAYRKTCAAMLDRFEKTDDPVTAGNLLLVCVLREDALADMSRLLPLTEVAKPIWHWGAWARGAALYRAGRYEESIDCFETAERMHRPRAWEWCFQAMAHHRLGQAEEARRCLVEAANWIDEANRVQVDDPTTMGPRWGNWHESVVYPLLLRETAALLGEMDKMN